MVCNESDNKVLGNQLIGVYRGWDGLEKQGSAPHSGRRVDVIDFDVAPLQNPHNLHYNNRGEVERNLLKLIGHWDVAKTDGQYLQQKTIASLAFLFALREESRSPIPINDYLQTTMGITLAEGVERPQLDKQYNIVRDSAKDVGSRWTKEGWEEYLAANYIIPSDFMIGFLKAESELMPIATDYLRLRHLPTDPPFYKASFHSIDSGTVAWISGSKQGGFELKINTNPINRVRFVRGASEIYYIHEILGHGLQHLSYMYNSDIGLINPAYGITTIPGPEQFGLEGSAITAPYLIRPLRDKLSPHALFKLEQGVLEEMVQLNALIALNNAWDDPNIRRVTKEMVKYYLPSETDERINCMFDDMTTNVLWRSYFVAYAEGTLFLKQAAQELSDESRQRLARYFYEKPRTPKQIEQLVADLKARDRANMDSDPSTEAA